MPSLILSITNRNILIHNNLTTGHKKTTETKNITEDAVALQHGLTQEASTLSDSESCLLRKSGTADIFRGFMVSLYVKGKENGHVQAYAPTGAMGLKRWGGLTSKLGGLPIASDPHLWWQACP